MIKKSLGIISMLFVLLFVSQGDLSANGTREMMDKEFFAFNEPTFRSKKANNNSVYKPQPILVLEKRSDGWWKIQTWEGPKWIFQKAEIYHKAFNFHVYNEPTFEAAKANRGIEYPPHPLIIIEKRSDGWWKIDTWEGAKWTYHHSTRIDKEFFAFDDPTFRSKKANNNKAYIPQSPNVVEKRSDGWWKIETWEGLKWIFPKADIFDINKNFYAYNEPSPHSQKANNGGVYTPQRMIVLEKRSDGWWKVDTWEGSKWIFPNEVTNPIACGRNDNVPKAAARAYAPTINVPRLNVDSKSTSDSVTLKWNDISDKYNVYVKDQLVWSGSESTYTHKDLDGNTRYTFKVVAFDNNNKPMDISTVQAMTKENKNLAVARSAAVASPSVTTVLDNVQVVANIAQDKIEQKWYGIIPDDDGTYEIYRNDVRIGKTQSPCFIDTTVSPGSHYFYKFIGKTKVTDAKEIQEIKDKGGSPEKDGNYYHYYEVGNESIIEALEDFTYASPARITIPSYEYDFQYQFRYQTFIPDATVSDWMTDRAFGKGTVLHGDGRGFYYNAISYRTKTEVLARFTNSGSSVKLLEAKVGPSIMIHPKDGTITKTASNSGISLRTDVSTKKYLEFTVQHEVGIPFKGWGFVNLPAIDYRYSVFMHLRGDHFIRGHHDMAPSHEMYLRRPYTDIPITTLLQSENKGLWALGGYRKTFKYHF
ncbi:fibronectin type III domain-containing protein [Priestia taiwanensis]|uniref:Fibronectin type-III domain-containing protein n=1 Tax=Priestia taiwanensis TaxID=1347902 RepID=A0A917AS34_9BACI|nr:fibronectin type III domain-containing protein [Priestia taiwanensis]MBM7363935.1 hypothetical protein [Priestia taiwanensis]GGE70278.1 hypothetical protein GCM10007140_20260 [Priestia taiwanensis]